MDINTGDIAVASVQSVGAVENIKVDDLNETNYNVVRVTRGGTDKATLLYRAVFADDGTGNAASTAISGFCLLYTSPSPRDQRGSRMPSSA